ncbi:hypothetical protein PTKIN_Ptkin17bG0151000 [Pterospermum kingtungense]
MASEKNKTPSSSDLFSSAKLVAGAAKSTFSNEGDKVDKGKVAGAGADLLGAAQDYGKLDKDKGVGQYVEKAENYLHQYETSGKSAPTTTEAQQKPHGSGGDGKDSGSGGGVGDYMKMAQGFLGK